MLLSESPAIPSRFAVNQVGIQSETKYLMEIHQKMLKIDEKVMKTKRAS